MADHGHTDQTARTVHSADWNKRIFLVVVSLALAAGAVALFLNGWIAAVWHSFFYRGAQQGAVYVYQFDYDYQPQSITWRVGDRVTIALRNMSDTHWHEMAIGQAFDNVPSMFGPIPTQFHRDFWDGVHVTISHAAHVDNLVLNNAIPTYVGPKPNLASGGDFSPTLKPRGSINLTFTVPNKPGVWRYGCFVQQYMHYTDGMKGTITILPSGA